VYSWNASLAKYTQLGSKMDGEFVFECSGYSVSLSGDVSVLAIGAICNDCNGAISEHVHLNCWDVGLAKKYSVAWLGISAEFQFSSNFGPLFPEIFSFSVLFQLENRSGSRNLF
jgi:hypothetical protein